MGRYGIGARVRDFDGDLAEVIGKPEKGYRDVRVIGGKFDGMTYWAPKSELTVVDEAPPAACCAEKGEVAFAVGDRVVFTTKDTGHGAVYHDEVLTVVALTADGVNVEYPPFGQWTEHSLTQVTTPDCLRPFTIEAGKFYRTRDGRKVGPMVERRGGYFYARGENHSDYNENGISAFLGRLPAESGRDHNDIVAEWVESATNEPWTDFGQWDAAVAAKWVPAEGDYVRPIGKDRDWVLSHWADHWSRTDGHGPAAEFYITGVTPYGLKISDVIGGSGPYWTDVEWEPAVAPATAEPQPVWEPAVGDKIRRISTPYTFVPMGYESTIVRLPSGVLGYVDDDGDSMQFQADRWELIEAAKPVITSPTINVGTDVILTAPARVTGFDKRNAHIVLDTGGSFVLPIASLQAA